ncbi:MAG TPA: S46 family peptidase, partial [Planctomycetota bacterium]|nr:S46 family peptidase [Planctomycetota bacterium]
MIHKSLIALILWSGLALAPDEGQWLPQQFLDQDWEALKRRGLTLTKDEFWHPERGGVLSAAVQINGCSASLISPEGLVITNHHCAFGAIERASTVERNYVENGFVADTREDEIPAAGVQLRIVRKIEDVTAKIHAAEEGKATALEKLEAVEARIRELEQEGETSAPFTECRISSYLEGRIYTMAYRTLIQDVRLVYAPPKSIGEFGGEVDNWEWPRHTGDFTFLRAYVGKDGKPAPYSKENVPLRPEHYLRISDKGLSEGDLVMILGYPGRTSRYLTSVAVEAQQ